VLLLVAFGMTLNWSRVRVGATFFLERLVKKILALVGVGLVSVCHAEDATFPTAILGQGTMDAAFSVVSDSNSSNINFNGNPGRQSLDITVESAQIRYGLGSDWHVGARLAYRSEGVVRTDFSSPPGHFVDTTSEGRQNPSLWASYGFINDKASPFSLSGTVQVSPDTTDKEASSYSGQLVAGWWANRALRLYGGYSATTSRDSNTANSTGIFVGAHKYFSETAALIPRAGYKRYRATDTYSSRTQYQIGLSSRVRLMRNTYILPGITLYRNSSGESKDGLFRRDATANGRVLILEFYHLF
jgi:hypothetical protein